MNSYNQELLSSFGDNVYAAEKLINKRKRKGKVEYLVKWKDWSSEDSTWEVESNILDERLIEEFERSRVKIKYENESQSTSIAGRSLRKTPARACANSLYTLEDNSRAIKNDHQSINHQNNQLNDSIDLNITHKTSLKDVDKNVKILIEDFHLDEFNKKQKNEADKIINKERFMNYYRNYRVDEDSSNQMNIDQRIEDQKIKEHHRIDQMDISSSEEEEENYSTSSYSPQSSQDSNEYCNSIDHCKKKTKANDLTNQITNKMTPNQTKTNKNLINYHKLKVKTNSQILKDSMRSIKSSEHVRNNLTNLNQLNPTTLKISIKNNKNFNFIPQESSTDTKNFNNQNDELTDEETSSSSGSNSTDSSLNDSSVNSNISSLEFLDNRMTNRLIWTPKLFKDRIQFANQIVITQIKNITFKESRKGFPKIT